ncbi:MAG: helix-turn-helix domain-containing protein [Pseudomonadota bacterium]
MTSVADDRLTAEEAAAFLGEPTHVVRRLCREKRIPHYRIGRYLRLSRAALLAWRDAQLTPTPPLP